MKKRILALSLALMLGITLFPGVGARAETNISEAETISVYEESENTKETETEIEPESESIMETEESIAETEDCEEESTELSDTTESESETETEIGTTESEPVAETEEIEAEAEASPQSRPSLKLPTKEDLAEAGAYLSSIITGGSLIQTYAVGTVYWKETNNVLYLSSTQLDSGYMAISNTTSDHPWSNNITSCTVMNKIQPTSLGKYFQNCTKLTKITYPGNIDTSNCTYFYNMFYNCTSLTTVDVSSWNMSAAQNISSMFYKCTALKTINTSNWVTSSVTDANHLFAECSALTAADVSGWNLGKLQNASSIFENCSSITSLATTNWNLTSVTTLMNAFHGCSSLKTLNTTNWSLPNAKDIAATFSGCSSLTSINASKWGLSTNLTQLQYAFYGCSGLTSLNVGNWNTSKVTIMDGIFNGCSSLTSLNLSTWNLSSLTTGAAAFSGMNHLATLYTPASLKSGTSVSLYRTKYQTGTNTYYTTLPTGTTLYYKMPVEIKKVDENGNVLTGAKLHIENADGTTMNSFTSDTTAYSNVYRPNTYTVVEDSAPKGYQVAENISFTLTDPYNNNTPSAKVITVVNKPEEVYWMVDEAGCLHLSHTKLSEEYASFTPGNGHPWPNTIKSCLVHNTITPLSMKEMFDGCSDLETFTNLGNIDTSVCTNMDNLFNGCASVKNLSLSYWDMSSVTSASGMFSGMTSLLKLVTPATMGSTKIDLYRTIYEDGTADTYSTMAAGKTLLFKVPVSINVQDQNGNTLSGTEYVILNEADEVVGTWSAAACSLDLIPGNYTLHQTDAPANYIMADDIPFTVTAAGEVLVNGQDMSTLVLEDTKLVPPTGVVTDNGAYFSAILIAAVVIAMEAVLYITKKKEQAHENDDGKH